jgi:hypothetical protein
MQTEREWQELLNVIEGREWGLFHKLLKEMKPGLRLLPNSLASFCRCFELEFILDTLDDLTGDKQ